MPQMEMYNAMYNNKMSTIYIFCQLVKVNGDTFNN